MVGCSCSSKIPVTIISKEVVAPSNHHHQQPPLIATRLPFSNLDYFYPANLYVSVYLCYAKPNKSGYDHRAVADLLRESLARTLSSFIVFAGEIVYNPSGEPESLLSGRGVDFFRATTKAELGDVDFYHPDVSVRGNLVPLVRQGVLAVQATEFKCGGLVVGITFDHRVADAYSANMFMLSWSEIALRGPGEHTSYVPNVNRSLLCSGQLGANGRITTSCYLNKWYKSGPREEPPVPLLDGDYHSQAPVVDEQFTSRTFYVEGDTIKGLQEKLCLENGYKTKYETFAAYLWKLLAKSVTNGATLYKLSIAVDGRTRIYDKTTQNAALMLNYFGNVLCYPFTEATADDLSSMSLSEAAELIHRCKVESTTSEHFSEVIGMVEEMRPMMPLVRGYVEEEGVMVSSGLGFPVEKVDFGWGRPVFSSYYFPWKGRTGYVMPMPSVGRGGDWVVFMHLPVKVMEVVDREGGEVLKPLVSSYLNLASH